MRIESSSSEEKDMLKWDFTNADIDDEVPTIVTTSNINTVRNGSLQIRLWLTVKNRKKLMGECWIGIPRLLRSEQFSLYHPESEFMGAFSTGGKANPSMHPHRNTAVTKYFEENLYYKGRKIGKTRGSLYINGLPFVY